MTVELTTAKPPTEKKYKCPVHGEFAQKNWAPHRRWCRAGAGGKRKPRRKPTARKLPKRKRTRAAKTARVATRTNGIRVVHGAKMGMIVFRNGQKETALLKVVYADERGMIQAIKKAVEKALE